MSAQADSMQNVTRHSHESASISVTAITPRQTLLMLAYWYWPDNESGALRPYRFCKFLPEYGYEPLVVAASSDSIVSAANNVFRASVANCRGRVTAWTARLARGLQRVLPYNDYLEWVPYAVSAAEQLMRKENVCIVMSTSPPLATHIAAFWLKQRYKVAWIADFRDPLVGNPFRARLHGRLYDVLLERRILSKADAIIVNTDSALEALGRRHPRFRDKIRLIWNGYDSEDEFVAAQIPPGRHKVIAHFGSLYGGRHPGTLLDSLQRLLQQGVLDARKVRVSLVGSIDRSKPWTAQSAFSDLAKRGCLEFSDRVLPRDEALRLMGEADYLLLLDLNELETGLQVPAKLFEYVRIGRPILTFTTKNSPVERILRQSGVAYVCIYPEDAEDEVDRKVLALLSLSTNPIQPSRWFEQQFDARRQMKSLVELLASVTRGSG